MIKKTILGILIVVFVMFNVFVLVSKIENKDASPMLDLRLTTELSDDTVTLAELETGEEVGIEFQISIKNVGVTDFDTNMVEYVNINYVESGVIKNQPLKTEDIYFETFQEGMLRSNESTSAVKEVKIKLDEKHSFQVEVKTTYGDVYKSNIVFPTTDINVEVSDLAVTSCVVVDISVTECVLDFKVTNLSDEDFVISSISSFKYYINGIYTPIMFSATIDGNEEYAETYNFLKKGESINCSVPITIFGDDEEVEIGIAYGPSDEHYAPTLQTTMSELGIE